jgi:plasmid stabilization system protein ParE
MAKRTIIWSSTAQELLNTIMHHYLKEDNNMMYCYKLSSNISNAVELIHENNYVGKSTNVQGVKILMLGNFKIFYEVVSSQVRILFLWDSRFKPENLKL